MAVRFVEVSEAADALRWHDVEERCTPIDHPGMAADPPEAAVGALTHPTSTERLLLLLAIEGDEVVGNGTLWLPLRDNLQLAGAGVRVLPEHRRRGIGRQLAEHVLSLARREGRTHAIGSVGSPLDAESPGSALARDLGATPALEALRRRLELDDVDDESLERLRRTLVGDRADGYEVVVWVDEVPDHLVDGAARLMAAMSTDTPMGDLEFEPERWDAARYREKETQAKEGGMRRVAAGAVEVATSTMVAYTDVGVALTRPAVAHQWDTIVDVGHRGHRLGLAIKLANLAHLRRAVPRVSAVVTQNAAANAHMVAINDLLGFRPVERVTSWQLSL